MKEQACAGPGLPADGKCYILENEILLSRSQQQLALVEFSVPELHPAAEPHVVLHW